MTILSVCQAVASVIGIDIPTAVMGSTEREHIELRNLANEMAERIAFDLAYDWSQLKRLGTLTGDGTSEGFSFPSDYRRMLKVARLWPSTSPFTTLQHYADTDHWLGMEVQNFRQIIGGWTIIGDQIMIKPVRGAGDTVKFYYIHNQIIRGADNAPQSEFKADEDRFVLNERLLKLAITWQWKANKGQQYAEDLANYEDALSAIIGADRGSTVITVGARRLSGAELAFPGVIVP